MVEDTPHTILEHLRRESLDIYNRLHSIAEDAEFVNKVHLSYPDLPLIPNLRCGAWYTDPQYTSIEQTQTQDSPAYFKSTDGHYNNWSFNLRRPNVHLLRVVENGIILVDSTRAGKKLPDALSKTVPIWCAVVNRAIVRRHTLSKENWDTGLYTPPQVVSRQEHEQISRQIDKWAEELALSSFQLPKLQCPLRPLWITPSSTSFPSISSENVFIPVICVSASKQTRDGVERRSGSFSYVQGSGDDHEQWGRGLTSDLFWIKKSELLSASRQDLPNLLNSLLHRRETALSHKAGLWVPISYVSGLLALSSIPRTGKKTALHGEATAHIFLPTCSDLEDSNISLTGHDELPTSLTITITPGKKGQVRFIEKVLPPSMHFIKSWLCRGHSVCIASEDEKDQSVGVALTALALYFNAAGEFDDRVSETNKKMIRNRLEWIIASHSAANPSRTTLKRVNEYILSRHYPIQRFRPLHAQESGQKGALGA